MNMHEREALTAHIAERLREARAGKNWSQDQLANECGWTQAAVSLYEAGHRRTGIYELCVLAEKLDRPLAFFLDDLPGRAALTAREEPKGDAVELMRRVLPFLMDYREPDGEAPPFECGEAEEMAVKRDIETLLAAREDTKRPDWKGHKLKLTIEDGGVYADLICPETGCDPPNICGKCGRYWDDEETERCYDCPTEKPKGCWLANWDELAEYLHGKVVVTVDIDAEWDQDAPSLTVVPDTEEPTR